MNCVCGSVKSTKHKQQLYEVTSKGDTIKTSSKDVSFVNCSACGIIRQAHLLFKNDKEYISFYRKNYEPISDHYIKKNYTHDKKLAVKRFRTYELKSKDHRLLDIGSGSGAFVDVCRSKGLEAYGCEMAEYNYALGSEHIYKQRFEDINFPTDYFDFITCHDVLEHNLNPIDFLKEVFRALKQKGTCVIDFPSFFAKEGKHHWKKEHLWFFNTEQLEKIVKDIGFTVTEIKSPIPSKIVFYIRKPKQNRVSILLPPGIGDSYWSIIKIKAFLEKKGIKGIPDIYTVCNREKEYNGHKRAFPFIKMFPFLNSTEMTFQNGIDKQKIWLEAYRDQGRTVFEGILGCDYFISYNGRLAHGQSMEELDSELECNWNPPIFISLEQEKYKEESIKKYGKYIVFSFHFKGTYKYWTNQFSVQNLIESMNSIALETKCIPVLVGAMWDKEKDSSLDQISKGVKGCVDLRGETSVQQLFGLMRGSEMVVGYPSGVTIASASLLKVKTLIIWNDFYNRNFAWNCCVPSVRESTYFIENTNGLTKDIFVKQISGLIKKNVFVSRELTSYIPIPTVPEPIKKVPQQNAIMAITTRKEWIGLTFRKKIETLSDKFISLSRNDKGLWQVIFRKDVNSSVQESPWDSSFISGLDYAHENTL